MLYRETDPGEETATTQQQVVSEKPEQPEELSGHLTDTPKQEEHKERIKSIIFFRIWFGLSDRMLIKTAIGSIAAALSGISKPVFGFFIITIGVAYYTSDDMKRDVGWYSIMFSSIGFLSLFSHSLQHYFFGVVGEKATTNIRRALYSGISTRIYLYIIYSLARVNVLVNAKISFHQPID